MREIDAYWSSLNKIPLVREFLVSAATCILRG